jgi:hypothetical protein
MEGGLTFRLIVLSALAYPASVQLRFHECEEATNGTR